MTSTTNDQISTATVQTLTAEVRVLQVGSRQVTLSVFRQLDSVPYDDLEPFGRVRDGGRPHSIEVVGRHNGTGALVRSAVVDPELWKYMPVESRPTFDQCACDWAQASSLPLIVLAGLK